METAFRGWSVEVNVNVLKENTHVLRLRAFKTSEFIKTSNGIVSDCELLPPGTQEVKKQNSVAKI